MKEQSPFGIGTTVKISGAIVLVGVLGALSCGGGSSVPAPTTPSVPAIPPTAPPETTPVHRALVTVASDPGASGAYVRGSRIVLHAAQDREARVEGAPRLAIRIGDRVRFAAFTPWPGDEWPPERLQFRHQFVYEIQADDQDENGISIGADAFDFAGGAFLNAAGEKVGVRIESVAPSASTTPTQAGRDLATHRVNGAVAPAVLPARVSIYSVPSYYSLTYTEGMWLRLTAEFDEPVKVVENPRIAIQFGDDTRYAHATPEEGYRNSGPDHRARRDTLLRFDYLIQADDRDPDGIRIDADAFDFTEGAIRDRGGAEINVEITSITPAEHFDTGGINPRRRWAATREPGLDIPEHPAAGRPPPRVCTDERQRARGRNPILVEEWDGTPFTFYFSTNFRTVDGLPSHLRDEAEEVLVAAERLAERIEDQIGYPIFEVGGFLKDRRARYPSFDLRRSCSWREPGQIVGFYWENSGSGNEVNHRCAMWGQSLVSPTVQTSTQTFHLFGFDYSPNDWRKTHDYWKGYWRSLRLTGVYVDEDDLGVAFEDVDALRCIFPKGG